MAITDYFLLANQACTTTEVGYTVPTNVMAISLCARGGNVQLRLTAAAAAYKTLYDGVEFPFQNRNIAGQTIYFDMAAGTADVEIFGLLKAAC